MAQSVKKINVYLEIGQKRTFAGALDWPGWCRSGRDEESALQALFDYGSRYARVLRTARLGFQVPRDISLFVVKERIEGNATTDFGAPGLAPSSDAEPVDSAELQRFQKLLRACWRALESTLDTATGKTLQTGPRGGGRQLDGILEHVLGADEGYLGSVGWKFKRNPQDEVAQQLKQTLQAALDALTASARGEIPAKGPRGGLRWSPRYFVRRVAWHTLDHVWEIEDRLSVD
ncbi:MAG TPA: hypothetical protein VK897_24595 [Anaerolineales bacterium]|nr:hypothetical protein [Anaerolineales bacterium]